MSFLDLFSHSGAWYGQKAFTAYITKKGKLYRIMSAWKAVRRRLCIYHAALGCALSHLPTIIVMSALYVTRRRIISLPSTLCDDLLKRNLDANKIPCGTDRGLGFAGGGA